MCTTEIWIAKKRVKAGTRKRFAVSGLRDAMRTFLLEPVWLVSSLPPKRDLCCINHTIPDDLPHLYPTYHLIPTLFNYITHLFHKPFMHLLLKELIDRRNLLFQRWLRSGRNSDRQRYILQRREVTKAVKKAKNDWLQEKASEVEVAMMFGGLKGACGRV